MLRLQPCYAVLLLTTPVHAATCKQDNQIYQLATTALVDTAVMVGDVPAGSDLYRALGPVDNDVYILYNHAMLEADCAATQGAGRELAKDLSSAQAVIDRDPLAPTAASQWQTVINDLDQLIAQVQSATD